MISGLAASRSGAGALISTCWAHTAGLMARRASVNPTPPTSVLISSLYSGATLGAMSRLTALLALTALFTACASLDTGPVPTRAVDFKPSEIRQPAVYVRLSFGPGEWNQGERAALPAGYESALLEGLNAKAVLARDVQMIPERDTRFDGPAAVARARTIGADHAILVDVRVSQGVATFCTKTSRPLRGPAMVLSQQVEVLRARDGAPRLRIIRGSGLGVASVEVDCDNPRDARRLTPEETLGAAVEKLLVRVFGP